MGLVSGLTLFSQLTPENAFFVGYAPGERFGNRIAQSGELPDAVITASGLKITPLVSAVPEETDQLCGRPTPCCRTSRSPSCCSKSTIGLGLHGTLHTLIKSEEVPKDRVLLLTAILADAINLGLTKIGWRQL